MDGETFRQADFMAWLAEKRLMGNRCRSCGALHVPPRPICPACFGEDLEWVELSGRGKLAAFTAVYIAPTAMIEAGYGRDNPYLAGIVELAEGPKISAQIIGLDASRPEQVAVGTPLQVAFLEWGEGDARHTVLAFEPVGSDR